MPVRLVKDVAETLESLVYELDQVTRQAKLFEEQRKQLSMRVTEQLRQRQQKSLRFGDPTDAESELKVVYVANRRVSVDAAKVRSAMGRDYSKVRSDDVDREKLDRFLDGADDETKAKVAKGITITEYPTVRLYHVAREESGGEK